MMIEAYEFTYFTIFYTCGHLAARPVRREHVDVPEDERTIHSPFKCHACKGLDKQALERRMERMKGQAS